MKSATIERSSLVLRISDHVPAVSFDRWKISIPSAYDTVRWGSSRIQKVEPFRMRKCQLDKS